jgi:hypothetical protein
MQNKNVNNVGDNKPYLFFFYFFNKYYISYIWQVWYSLADVNKGNAQVIKKKVNHSVEKH